MHHSANLANAIAYGSANSRCVFFYSKGHGGLGQGEEIFSQNVQVSNSFGKGEHSCTILQLCIVCGTVIYFSVLATKRKLGRPNNIL